MRRNWPAWNHRSCVQSSIRTIILCWTILEQAIVFTRLKCYRKWYGSLIKSVTGGTMPNKDMSIDHRFEYLKQQYERYHAASREDKGRLLDEMTTYTGMHRKTVIRLMRSEPKRAPAKPRYKRRIYGTDVERVIRVIAKALDYPCRERLTPMLPTMADHLGRLGVLEIEAETQELLERISVSTVGRIMTRVRQDEPRLRRRAQNGRVTRIHAQVPIRTIPWYQSMPGHLEADLVQHSGPNPSGEFLYTLQLVDVATGWSELAAVLGKSYRVISDGFNRCLAVSPLLCMRSIPTMAPSSSIAIC